MRAGVIGPMGSDSFADNIADALLRMGHQVRQLGPARAYYRQRQTTRIVGLARQAVPRLDNAMQGPIVRKAL
jgi:hypothetical protein